MRTLYLLCGLSFSGKSTFARRWVAATAMPCISLDDINRERGLWGGDGIPVEEWERTHTLAHERFAALARSGADALVDDTNCFRWLRDRWRSRAEAEGYRSCVLFIDTPLDEIARRRALNGVEAARRGVRDEVFAQLAATFEAPTADEVVHRYAPTDEFRIWMEARRPGPGGPGGG